MCSSIFNSLTRVEADQYAAMDARGKAIPKHVYLITFSGLDGSGKSTQISNLRAQLESAGLDTLLLAFWDDVVVSKKYREGFVHKVYKSEKGIGAPDKPVARRDKNVRKWYLSVARHGLYLADAFHLRRVIAHAKRSGADVIIMDRYIFDELANLPLRNEVSRSFAWWVGRTVVPRPDIAFLLDADPEAARARKPEYPVEFMRECRNWYYRLADLLRFMTIIPPLPLEQAKQAVVDRVQQLLPSIVKPRLKQTA